MPSLSQKLLSIISKITRWACEFVFGKVLVLALVPADGVMRSHGDEEESCGCGGKCDCEGECNC